MRNIPIFFCLTLFASAFLRAQVEGREWEESGAPKDLERVLRHMPPGSRSIFAPLKMRDGTTLATSIFLPPGDGPWPVLLQKGFYGRFGMADGARAAKDGKSVFILQDARGRGDSGGKGSFEASSFDIHIQDMSDTLDWIRDQPWCNGRIGVSGGSGNGIAAVHAFLTGHPNLKAASANNTSGFAADWMYENRVRRGLASWMSHNNFALRPWPRPNPAPQSIEEQRAALKAFAPHADSVLVANAAWFDILSESALELFEAFSAKATVYLVISPSWHGGETKVDAAGWPNFWGRNSDLPSFAALLDGGAARPPSQVLYYLMGDPGNPKSAGNEWRRTGVWPPPHTPLRLFLHGDGTLAPRPPAEAATRGYTYDPRDPTPAFGGNGSYTIPMGPMDQRPLRDRKDLLYFVSDPLPAPVVFVGRVSGQLRVSSDAPDTLFVLKLIDIHPGGRETLIRETAVMARFAEELDGKTPLTSGNVYTLPFKFWSTAWALNPGHRLGLIVTSASVLEGPRGPHEVYEVHPNAFEPVPGIDSTRPARQALHLEPDAPAFLILPVLRDP